MTDYQKGLVEDAQLRLKKFMAEATVHAPHITGFVAAWYDDDGNVCYAAGGGSILELGLATRLHAILTEEATEPDDDDDDDEMEPS